MKERAPRLRILLRWMWQTSHTHRRRILLNCLPGLFSVLFSLLFIWYTKRVIDCATGQLHSTLWIEGTYTAIILAAQIITSSFSTWLTNRLQVDVANQMRQDLFQRMLNSRWDALQALHTGDVINRIEQDTTQMVTLFTSTLPSVITSGIQLLAGFALFSYLDTTLACIILAIVPVCLLFSKLYIRRMRRFTREIRHSDSQIQSIIQESMQHRTVIKTLEEQPHQLEQLVNQQQTLRTQINVRTRFSIFSRLVLAIGFSGGYLTAFLWGSNQLSESLITFGTMTAFLQLVNQIQSPAYSLSQLLPGVIQTLTSAERLIELETIPTEEQGTPIQLPGILGLSLYNLTFRYSDQRGEKAIFNGLTYHFAPGSRTAILGETGAGKTTLVRLLLALVHPTEGEIKLYSTEELSTTSMGQDSQPVSPLTRINFVYVPQGNTLFSGTIRQNLLMGCPKANDEEMHRALEIAEAHFVFELPEGIDSILTETGGGLSEGQAQRISIARSLLRPGGILLFDEATSALDPETEQRLFQNLRTHCAEKTMIFITHHPALAAQCDQVLEVF